MIRAPSEGCNPRNIELGTGRGDLNTVQSELTMIWTPSERVSLHKGLAGILHFLQPVE